jgi:hypothetical protein
MSVMITIFPVLSLSFTTFMVGIFWGDFDDYDFFCILWGAGGRVPLCLMVMQRLDFVV